jgi:hypothetical protein
MMSDLASQLERLESLKQSGTLSEAEFTQAKLALLTSSSGPTRWEYKDITIPLDLKVHGSYADHAAQKGAIRADAMIMQAIQVVSTEGWESDENASFGSLYNSNRVKWKQGVSLLRGTFHFKTATLRMRRPAT